MRPSLASLAPSTLSEWVQARVPIWMVVLVSMAIGVLLAAAITGLKEVATALVGLVGVAVGGVISAQANLRSAREAQRAQILSATLAKRLDSHQAAFAIWRRVPSATHDEEKRMTVLRAAEDWWDNHCLYMSDEASAAFFQMIKSADFHHVLLEMRHSPQPPADIDDQINSNWDRIVETGQILAKGADRHVTEKMLEELRAMK
jgi:hypothetical protein